MEYYNNILAVSANWLIEQGILGEANYKQLKARGDIHVLNRGCRNTSAMVAFESMPERFKSKVLEKVADPYKAAQVNELEAFIEHSTEASAYYDNYELDDSRHLPINKRREYYANAIILNAIISFIATRRRKNANRWNIISDLTQELDRTQYPHALPSNARSLERKVNEYRTGGYEVLIHKAYLNSNKNAGKVVTEEQQDMLLFFLSDSRNFNDAQVRDLYNKVAVAYSWVSISSATVGVWRKKNEDVIYARRHGASSYMNNKAMQVKRSAPTMPLIYWTMDGWDAELLYQKQEDGRTTYHNRVTVVFVLDACKKYPIGYAIGTHETPELIKEALRNAALHTEQLFGQMYRTAQLQSDNYAISKMMPTYEGMALKATPAKVRNAKSKIIEPWFNYFNKKYCQLQKNWSGYGVTSRKELQPNSDFLNKYRNDFPTFDGVCAQIIRFIEMERAEIVQDYVALFHQMPIEKLTPLDYKHYLMLFGSTTGHRNLLRGSGLKVTIQGKKYDYDCFDTQFRHYASVRWEIRYDPNDMQRVLAVNEDETLQFLLEEKYVQPMALAERKEGDYEALERVREFNRKMDENVAMRLGQAHDTVTTLLGNRKELDTLSKLMICDSNGQHKDRRNGERLHQIEEAKLMDDPFDQTDLLDEY